MWGAARAAADHRPSDSAAAPTACLDTYGEPKIERIKNARPFITRYPE